MGKGGKGGRKRREGRRIKEEGTEVLDKVRTEEGGDKEKGGKGKE